MDCTFEGVYEACHASLRRFVLNRVANADTADDILQDVYLRIHAHIGGVRDCRKLEAWVYQVARHAIIDHYRSRRPTTELPEMLRLPENLCADSVECEL